ncbi:MAG: leucyl/phenylalanyl-tRNA--protein transferase [bacterium]|nr:leucyl/phenylalanyl-tRNA--protein transferase [bacterium]
MSRYFPQVSETDDDGLLAFSEKISTPLLVDAYNNGIFPWPLAEGAPVPWFAPNERALLFLSELKINRSFKRTLKAHPWTVTLNRCTEEVIRQCATSNNRPGQTGTWITSEIIENYNTLAAHGLCYSVETWIDGNLAGGFYGVTIGAMVSGESMFYLCPGASRVALWALVNFLKCRNHTWIDCQVMTPFFASIGARNIPRDDFSTLLRKCLSQPPAFDNCNNGLVIHQSD